MCNTSDDIRDYNLRHGEDFILIWIDEAIRENKTSRNSIAQLRCVINTIEIFSSYLDSIEYVSKVEKERIFFIVSGTLVQDIVHRIHQYTQIDSIYIFCTQKQVHEIWTKAFRKVKGIHTHIEELLQQIQQDIRRSRHDLIRFDIVGKLAHVEKSNKQEASFMYTQLLKETLLQMTDGDQFELVEFCRPQYEGNSTELCFINELEHTYTDHSPVWWYTKPNFLYKMLNKALRDLHVETLYAFRHFIRHLHEQLVQLNQKSILTTKIVTLYRGQRMQNEQINELKLNQGGLLSIANFLSTSMDKEVALMFAGEMHNDDSTMPVLMIIQAECSQKTGNVAFADIDAFSFLVGSEKEWLFSMGSVFRIEEIEKFADEIWVVHLTLTNDHDLQLVALLEHLRKECQDTVCTPLMQLSRLMAEMGEWSRAERFFQKALKTESAPERCTFILNDLGMISWNKNEIDEALDYFQESLHIKQEHTSQDNPPLSSIYNNIGVIYRKKNMLDLALEYFSHALHADVTSAKPNQQWIATRYSNIAGVLSDQSKYEESLKYFRLCLNIDLSTLPPTHPSVARTYHHMATTLDKSGHLTEALEYERKAVDIVHKSLPLRHPYVEEYTEKLELYQEKIKS